MLPCFTQQNVHAGFNQEERGKVNSTQWESQIVSQEMGEIGVGWKRNRIYDEAQIMRSCETNDGGR